jgi:hypothetical protein
MKLKTLLLTLLLSISLNAFSKVGDVYYCSKAQSVLLHTTGNANITNKPYGFFKDKFKFKRGEKEIVFDDFPIDKIPYSSFWNSEISEVFWSNKNHLYGFKYNNGSMSLIDFRGRDDIASALYKCSIF